MSIRPKQSPTAEYTLGLYFGADRFHCEGGELPQVLTQVLGTRTFLHTEMPGAVYTVCYSGRDSNFYLDGVAGSNQPVSAKDYLIVSGMCLEGSDIFFDSFSTTILRVMDTQYAAENSDLGD